MSNSEAHVVDRTGWPSGPWNEEPDKLQFRTRAGLPGLIARGPMGNLCGYAAVNRSHPLYEVPYEVPDLEVHGGLTYSNRCRDHICHVPVPGEPDDVWWFGFDCAHAFDVVPRMRASDLRAGMPAHLSEHLGARETYRDVEYVRAEVERLAEQLMVISGQARAR